MEEEKKRLSISDACFSTIKSAMGLGLLYIPASLAKTGWIGLMLFFAMGLLSSISLYVCSRVIKTCGKYDFLGISKETLGGLGKTITIVFFGGYIGGACLVFFGSMVLYLKQTICLIFNNLDEDGFILKLSATLFVLVASGALCFIKNLRFISKLAALGFVGIIYTLFLLFFNTFFRKDDITAPTMPVFSIDAWLGLLLALSFAFGNNFTYMACVRDLKNPTNKRCNTIIVVCGIVETAVYVLFAGFGYYLFGAEIAEYKPEDVLSVGSNRSKLRSILKEATSKQFSFFYQLGSGFMFLAILFTFPLLVGPLREMIMLSITPKNQNKTKISFLFNFLTVFLCCSFALVYFVIGDMVEKVINVVSGIAGSFVFFILPASFFIVTEKPFKKRNISDTAVFLLVMLTGLACLIGFLFSYLQKML